MARDARVTPVPVTPVPVTPVPVTPVRLARWTVGGVSGGIRRPHTEGGAVRC